MSTTAPPPSVTRQQSAAESGELISVDASTSSTVSGPASWRNAFGLSSAHSRAATATSARCSRPARTVQVGAARPSRSTTAGTAGRTAPRTAPRACAPRTRRRASATAPSAGWWRTRSRRPSAWPASIACAARATYSRTPSRRRTSSRPTTAAGRGSRRAALVENRATLVVARPSTSPSVRPASASARVTACVWSSRIAAAGDAEVALGGAHERDATCVIAARPPSRRRGRRRRGPCRRRTSTVDSTVTRSPAPSRVGLDRGDGGDAADRSRRRTRGS